MEVPLVAANVLRAVANFADPKDVREQLRGVWAENSRAGLVLWASDGGAVVGLRVSDMAPCESFEVLIPWTAIAMLPRTKKPVALILGASEPQLAVEGVRIPCAGVSELRMPQYRRVIPGEVSHQPAQFNTALLAKFSELALALGRKKGASGWNLLSHNGQHTARIHIPDHPEVVGAVSPLREHAVALPDDQPFTPEWAC